MSFPVCPFPLSFVSPLLSSFSSCVLSVCIRSQKLDHVVCVVVWQGPGREGNTISIWIFYILVGKQQRETHNPFLNIDHRKHESVWRIIGPKELHHPPQSITNLTQDGCRAKESILLQFRRRAAAGDADGVKLSWQLFGNSAQSPNYHRNNLSLNLP